MNITKTMNIILKDSTFVGSGFIFETASQYLACIVDLTQGESP